MNLKRREFFKVSKQSKDNAELQISEDRSKDKCTNSVRQQTCLIGRREQRKRGATNLLFPCLICFFSGGRGQGKRVGTELTFSMSHLFLLLPGIQGLADRGHQQQQQQGHQQVLQLLQHHGKQDRRYGTFWDKYHSRFTSDFTLWRVLLYGLSRYCFRAFAGGYKLESLGPLFNSGSSMATGITHMYRRHFPKILAIFECFTCWELWS